MYALIAVENTAYSFDRLFTYRVPAGLTVRAGVRVLVPFGAGKRPPRIGVVFQLCENPPQDDVKIKDIAAVLDSESLLGEDSLATAAYLHEHCFCCWYDAVRCQMPVGLVHRVRRAYIAAPSAAGVTEAPTNLSPDEQQILDYLQRRKVYVREDLLCKNLGITADSRALVSLLKAGLVIESAAASRAVGDASAKTARIKPLDCESGKVKLTQKQKEVIKLLQDFEALTVREICEWTGYTPAVVLALENKGLLELYDSAVYRIPETPEPGNSPSLLTTLQRNVCRALWKRMNNPDEVRKGCTALLHGVTGSGKTQVYLALAEAVLKSGRGVMIMVPEIALTPHLLSQVTARFGNSNARGSSGVALFHSALSAGERADAWRRVASGESNVVVGTRSAVFAPLQNIGLIVMDEEQEDSYKSGVTPRYDAREVAKFRAKRHGALLLLGSATPSVESYAAAQEGQYSLHVLPERYGNALLPEVRIVDMSFENYGKTPSLFSRALCQALTQTLEKGEQAVLLLNRRGYNTFAVCRACHTVASCPQCSISLTYHAAESRLLCHYCGYSRHFSTQCDNCKNAAVQFFGFGTQRAEEQLSQIFPKARIARMDTDATSVKGSHSRILESFRKREFDILLGTQMVAKGLDFENVTLVGALNIDSQLHDDDYRCLERTFSLLTQVVGRAGRGEKRGHAIIQTVTPEETTLELAARQDYAAFFSNEISLRKMLVYPPYCSLFALCFACENRTAAESAARFALDFITGRGDTEKMMILGPMYARIMKLGGKYRYRLILKTKNTSKVRAMLSELLIALNGKREYSEVNTSIGRNPAELM